jgi:osmoprotectant transport system substrate-binding protein
MKFHQLTLGAATVALAITLAACGDPTSDGASSDGAKAAADSITVGSAAFPESEIVAEIYAQALEAQGVKVSKKLNIGAREVYIPALQNGEIDLLPEYSGNLLTFFDPEATATTAQEIEDKLDDVLPDQLEVLDASPAENKDSLVVTPEFAEKNKVASIEDLATLEGVTIGANPEFKERPYGIPGLEKVYGLSGLKFVPIGDGGGPKTLKSLLDGDIDVADIYSTTPSISANKLVTLSDPKNLIAAQNVIPLISDAKASDKVEDILDKVSAALTTQDLLDLNAKNQGEQKTAPAQLAKEWLTAKNLL